MLLLTMKSLEFAEKLYAFDTSNDNFVNKRYNVFNANCEFYVHLMFLFLMPNSVHVYLMFPLHTVTKQNKYT